MEFLQAIILGLVQGITEFVPISSSGHLQLVPELFPFFKDQGLAFDAVLHLATALAIFFYFRKDWIAIIKSWRKDPALNIIVVASIPAAVAGVLFDSFIETTLRSPWVVVTMLLFISAVMWWVEHNYSFVKKVSGDKKKKELLGVDPLDAIIIGLFQIVALFPGTSRSGVTISAGMWRSLPREQAARFSFLLGAPITLGAGVVKLPELLSGGSSVDLNIVGIGAITAFITAVIAMHYLLRLFQSGTTLKPFIIYRVALAIIVALVLII